MTKVALLYNLNRNDEEFEADFDIPETIALLKETIEEIYECIEIECDLDVTGWTQKLYTEKPDLVFNITEGYHGVGREAFVPILLDQLSFIYTGPRSRELVICMDKVLTKDIIKMAGVNTADYILIKSHEDIKNINNIFDNTSITFIKLNGEGSSIGIDENSICLGYEKTKEQTILLLNKYKKDILIEQYIDGIDLNVTYIEGLGFFGPMEYVYPNEKKVYDYQLKMLDYDNIEVVIPNLTSLQRNELLEQAKKVVESIGIRGYCRLEFRMCSATGIFYFIESNAQVSFMKEGVFVFAVESENISFKKIILHIIENRLNNKL